MNALGVILFALVCGAAPSPHETLPGLADRLAALRPSDPGAYFLLGEELAAQATQPAERALARELLVLAYELDARRAETATTGAQRHDAAVPENMASSVCLALASIAESDERRAWLLALAAADVRDAPASAEPRPVASMGEQVDDATAFDLATAIGLVRAGEGRLALRLLDKPEVAALLHKLEGLLTPTGGSGGASRLRQLAERYQYCPECRNRRWTKDGSGVHLCATCGGHPGPAITPTEELYQLRLESVLLGNAADAAGVRDSDGGLRSWAAQAVVDHGAPLRELDMGELAEVYGVDADRPIWRDGHWQQAENPKP